MRQQLLLQLLPTTPRPIRASSHKHLRLVMVLLMLQQTSHRQNVRT